MTDNITIIGLLGRAGSGKSTVARYLRDKYGAEIVSFGLAVKNATHAFLVKLAAVHGGVMCLAGETAGVDTIRAYERNCLDDPALKEAWVVITTSYAPCAGCEDDDNPHATVTRLFTLRWLMQMIGTEVGRDVHGANAWVSLTFAAMQTLATASSKLFVVDDVRFPNEVEMIRSHGIIIKLTCTDDPVPANPHASENVDAIPAELIDEAVASHRTAGADHLIGEFDKALERLFTTHDAMFADTHGPSPRSAALRVHQALLQGSRG